MAYENERVRLSDTVTTNLQRINDLAPSAALSIGTAANDIEVAKRTVTQSLEDLYALNTRIQTDTDAITARAKDAGVSFNAAKKEASKLSNDVNKNKTLLEIRRAQAEALFEKYSANQHSSWLGLWRPLSDTSQVGLIAASIMFGLISLLSMFVLFRNGIPAFPSGATSQITQQSFFGGRRHFSTRN
jgi:hypothetical protein